MYGSFQPWLFWVAMLDFRGVFPTIIPLGFTVPKVFHTLHCEDMEFPLEIEIQSLIAIMFEVLC